MRQICCGSSCTRMDEWNRTTMSTDSSLATNAGDPKLSENHRDESVRPQDDLYRHANGTWLSSAQIPADQGSYGSFMALRDDSEAAVRAIIEAAAENRQAADGSVD